MSEDRRESQRRDWIDDLLHGAPLSPLLRPDASEAVRPRPGRQAHLRRPEKSTQCLPPGGWDAPERGRSHLPALSIL